MTNEEINSWLKDLEEITPGPWEVLCRTDGVGMTKWVISNIGASIGTSIADEIESGPARTDGPARRDAAHIARYDPDTIKSLLNEIMEYKMREVFK